MDVEQVARAVHATYCSTDHVRSWRPTDADEDTALEIFDLLGSRLLPEGWTFTATEHDDHVFYEVRNEHGFLIMFSAWKAS